jgi:hypothetical protein
LKMSATQQDRKREKQEWWRQHRWRQGDKERTGGPRQT